MTTWISAASPHGLNGVEQQIEQHLPQQLFIRLDGNRLALVSTLDFLFLKVVVQGAHHFVHDGIQRELGPADFARARVVDEFVQLHRDLVGFIHDGAGLLANFRRRLGLLGKHLRHAADDVERIARLVREAGGGEVHFLEVRVKFAGADEPDLQFGRLGKIAPRQPCAEGGHAREKYDDEPQPQIATQMAR